MTRLLLLIALAVPASADDWPTFRGPKRDGHSAETGLLETWPSKGPKQLWVAKKLGVGFSSATIVGKKIYVTGLFASDGKLTCLDTDGKQLWQVEYGKLPTAKKNYPGARTTPTVADGKVYTFSPYGLLSCFEADSGKVVWQVDTKEKYGARAIMFGISESPLVLGDRVIVTPGGREHGVIAFDRRTGEEIWKSPIPERAAYCSPIPLTFGERTVVVTWLRGSIVGIDAADGKVLWKHPAKNRVAVHPNTPVYRARDRLLFASCGYGFGCLTLQVSEDGGKVKQVMRQKLMDQWHGGVVLVEDHVFATGSRRPRGKWCAMDPRTGRIRFQVRGVGLGSAIAAEGKLYCYGESGKMALYRASPSKVQFKRLGGELRIKHGDGQHWAHPSIADGRLYVRHGNALAAYDIRKKPKK